MDRYPMNLSDIWIYAVLTYVKKENLWTWRINRDLGTRQMA